MKKLTALLAMCLLLTACTPKNNTTTSTSTTKATTTTTTATTTTAQTSSTTQTTTQTTTTTQSYPEYDAVIEIPSGAINVVTEWGIKEGEGFASQNYSTLSSRLRQVANGSVVYFPAGSYELSGSITLSSKKNIHIVGEHSTIVRCGVTNTANNQASSVFRVENCENITFEGLVFKYDVPTSLSGIITEKTSNTITVQITDGSQITGQEYVTIINSFSNEGVVNKKFEEYASSHFAAEKLSENVLRLSGVPAGSSTIGMRVCLRLSTGSEYIFKLRNTTATTFKNVTIRNSLNGGIHVDSRCKDLTLDNVWVKPEKSDHLMSTNADILHIASLGGTLSIDNCHFEKPGDDCVNVHDMAYTVSGVNGNRVSITAPRFSFSSSWAKAGDTIEFYDAQTFACLGTATVSSISGQTFTFNALPAGVQAGTVISNLSMHPSSVTIKNTTVEYNRARGFLLQNKNVTVENCTFKNTALAAILVAPDLDYWYEMSPASNVVIKNNVFENCGNYAWGPIQFSTDHDDSAKQYPAYIHSDIVVTGNTFITFNNRTTAFYGVCIENIEFTDNNFDDFKGKYITLTYSNDVTLDEIANTKTNFTEVTEVVIQ